MKKVLSVLLCSTFVLLFGKVCSAAEINGTKPFNLIEYCENHEFHSEEEIEAVLYPYIGESDPTYTYETNQDTLVSFELTIDYENQYVITTSVYEIDNLRSTKSGYAVKKYRSAAGYVVFKARVDGTFSYNGSTCSTTSASATFTPTPLLGWSSSPSVSSGKSGSKAYARAYGTATHGADSQYYSVYLYCDVSGNLTSS